MHLRLFGAVAQNHARFGAGVATLTPVQTVLGALTFVGFVRLENRGELSDLPGFRLGGDDSLVVLAAYQRWNSSCVRHLQGEFAFAIFDGLSNSLFLSVDHFANIPLGYWTEGARFAFASSPSRLLSIPEVPRAPNLNAILNLASGETSCEGPAETLHSGIFSITPGTCLTIDASGLRSETFWTPAIRDGLVPPDDDDAFAKLRELLIGSARNHLKGRRKPVCLLSGGLDSSSLAALVAREQASRGEELLTYSGVPAPSANIRFRHENDFIREFRAFPNVRSELFECPGRGPFDRLGEPGKYESSFLASSRKYVYEEFGKRAVSDGVDTIFDGCFGELSATVDGSPYYLELLLTMQWRMLASRLAARSRNSTGKPAVAVRALAAGLLRRLMARSVTPQPLVFLSRDSCRARPGKSGILPPAEHRAAHLKAVQDSLSRHSHRFGSKTIDEVHSCFPLRDRQILEFCLATPGDMKIRDGYSRYLIRQALDGILPKKIQWRTSKAPFSPDYFVRFNAQLPMAREFVRAIGPKDPVRSLVDVNELSRSLEPVHPVQGSFEALAIIPSTLYLICFLRQFPEFR